MDVTYTAHRGFAGATPENTRAAARFAVERGADRIELDVRPCADGTLVVFHDDRLAGRERPAGVTDAAGAVANAPIGTVQSATVLGSGETVPTLARYLGAVPDAPLNVELKSHGGTVRPGLRLSGPALADRTDRWSPFVGRVLRTLDGHGGSVLFSSFSHAALAAVRDHDDRPVAVVTGDPAAGLSIARAVDAEAIHPRLDRVAGTPPCDGADGNGEPDVVAAAHAEGRLVRAWTVTGWHEAASLVEAGVDGLIADYPGLLDWREDR